MESTDPALGGDPRAKERIQRLLSGDDVVAEPFGDGAWLVKSLTEKGLRRSRLWPSAEDAYEALLQTLGDAVEATEDPDERSRLERLRTTAAGVSKEVVQRLAVALVSKATGLE